MEKLMSGGSFDLGAIGFRIYNFVDLHVQEGVLTTAQAETLEEAKRNVRRELRL